MIGFPGPTEMIIIGIIAILLFGKRLPGVARSIGQSVFELKRGLSEVVGDEDEAPKLSEASRTSHTGGEPTSSS